MGFDLNGAVDGALDKAKDLVNEKAGKEVINEETAQKAKDAADNVVAGVSEKFGK